MFAVIVLSKTCNVGWDHLIHRKRSPFPYEGKDLMRRKVGVIFNIRRGTSHFSIVRASAKDVLKFAASEALPHGCALDEGRLVPSEGALKPSPCRGRGTACGG